MLRFILASNAHKYLNAHLSTHTHKGTSLKIIHTKKHVKKLHFLNKSILKLKLFIYLRQTADEHEEKDKKMR